MAADAVVDPDAPESGVWKWVKIGFFVVVAVGLIAIGTSTAGANGGLKLANALIAIVGGVLGAMVLFWLLSQTECFSVVGRLTVQSSPTGKL